MAFRVSNIMRAAGPRAGMELWWKAHMPVNGHITRHLSPFESEVLTPLAKDWQKKTFARFDDNKASLIPAVLFFIFMTKWCDWKNDQDHRHHRP